MTEVEAKKLLNDWQKGDEQSSRVLMEMAYLKLIEFARKSYGRLPEDVNTVFLSMSATDLAHEVYSNFMNSNIEITIETRREFFRYLNASVRNLMVDNYRKYVTSKSSTIEKTTLNSVGSLSQISVSLEDEISLIEINDQIEKMSSHYPRQSEALELRYFASKSNKEISKLLDVSLRTVENDLRFAKAWLKSRL
ncbi:MAG: sigma-70 family RNA polymerase sigma factor [Parashewanella sp.]